MTTLQTPQTLLEAIKYYSSEAVCVEFLSQLKWGGDEKCCTRCGSTAVYGMRTRPVFKCRDCKKQFSIKVGTVMEDSAIPITKWIPALWMIVNDKNGISSCEVARALGVTQKSAWFICHRIREAIQNGMFTKLSGEVEVDETFIGGKEQFKHGYKNRKIGHRVGPREGKFPVMGIVQRGGEVRAKVVDRVRRNILEPEVLKNVEEGATVYTDSLMSYYKLKDYYDHFFVDHSKGQYVDGKAHTNTMENFWSCFKRSMKGTYIHIASFHTDRYLDEQAFRYNNRKDNDSGRFLKAASLIFGKRLTYAELTGVR